MSSCGSYRLFTGEVLSYVSIMKCFLKGFELAISQELPEASGPIDPWPGRCPGPTGDPVAAQAPSLNFQYFENFQLSPMNFAKIAESDFVYTLTSANIDQSIQNLATLCP